MPCIRAVYTGEHLRALADLLADLVLVGEATPLHGVAGGDSGHVVEPMSCYVYVLGLALFGSDGRMYGEVRLIQKPRDEKNVKILDYEFRNFLTRRDAPSPFTDSPIPIPSPIACCQYKIRRNKLVIMCVITRTVPVQYKSHDKTLSQALSVWRCDM